MPSFMLLLRLPARLAHPGQLAPERELAQHDARHAELPVHGVGAAGDAAAAGDARRARVARQLREGLLRLELLLEREVRVLEALPEGGALLLVLRDQLRAALI